MSLSSPISFVLPAYNCERTLAESVDSIYQGNYEPGDEVVIVNDGSTDFTADVIDALGRRYEGIRAIRHNFNKGSAAAGRNTAIDAASHELIYCLDADNVLPAGTARLLLRGMRQQSADCATVEEVRYFVESPAAVTHSWKYKQGIVTLADALAGHVWPGPSGNYLFSRKSWVKAGRYHESLGGGVDSWAFGIRQLAAGCKMFVVPNTCYLHRFGHESAWTRDVKAGSVSLKAMQALVPILGLLEPASVERIFAPATRAVWFDQLNEVPLRLKGECVGENGLVVGAPPGRSIMSRIIGRLRSLVR